MTKITRNDAADILKSADKILILTHQSPDGDTLGSGYAICRALRLLNKQMCIRDSIYIILHSSASFGCAAQAPPNYRYFSMFCFYYD